MFVCFRVFILFFCPIVLCAILLYLSTVAVVVVRFGFFYSRLFCRHLWNFNSHFCCCFAFAFKLALSLTHTHAFIGTQIRTCSRTRTQILLLFYRMRYFCNSHSQLATLTQFMAGICTHFCYFCCFLLVFRQLRQFKAGGTFDSVCHFSIFISMCFSPLLSLCVGVSPFRWLHFSCHL